MIDLEKTQIPSGRYYAKTYSAFSYVVPGVYSRSFVVNSPGIQLTIKHSFNRFDCSLQLTCITNTKTTAGPDIHESEDDSLAALWNANEFNHHLSKRVSVWLTQRHQVWRQHFRDASHVCADNEQAWIIILPKFRRLRNDDVEVHLMNNHLHTSLADPHGCIHFRDWVHLCIFNHQISCWYL